MTTIVYKPAPRTTLDAACASALEVAREFATPVTLEFNGTSVAVSPLDDAANVAWRLRKELATPATGVYRLGEMK